MVQIDFEHRDFVEVRRRVIINPFDHVLTASVIDGTSHRARRVQGGKSATEDEGSNQEGLSAGHRAGMPARDRRMVVVETKNKK